MSDIEVIAYETPEESEAYEEMYKRRRVKGWRVKIRERYDKHRKK